jgi:Holliday junction resolvase
MRPKVDGAAKLNIKIFMLPSLIIHLMTPKEIGLKGEECVMNNLREKGWNIEEHNISRTKTDVKASRSGRTWLIQVKTSSSGDPEYPRPDEIGALNSRATRSRKNAVPVVALVWLKNERCATIKYYSARNRHELHP